MVIFIEGTAFPLGSINVNGWGIPFAEADNAIKSLKTSVVRICSRIDPHICDYMGDPNTEIGHVVDSGQDGDNVTCKAEITDTTAAQKIEDGTWKPFWSIFASTQDIDSGGWAHGVVIESITIVNNPAWDSAKWSVVSASENGKKRFHITSPFKIAASENEKTGDENIPDEPTIDELKAKLAEKDKIIEELKPKAEAVPELETQVSELTASKTELEMKLASSVPVGTLEEKISAAIEKHDKEVSARNTLAAARARFAAARKEHLGVETKDDELTSLSASDFTQLTSDIEKKFGAAAGSDPVQYNTSSGAGTVGRWDPIKKEWVV